MPDGKKMVGGSERLKGEVIANRHEILQVRPYGVLCCHVFMGTHVK